MLKDEVTIMPSLYYEQPHLAATINPRKQLHIKPQHYKISMNAKQSTILYYKNEVEKLVCRHFTAK